MGEQILAFDRYQKVNETVDVYFDEGNKYPNFPI